MTVLSMTSCAQTPLTPQGTRPPANPPPPTPASLHGCESAPTIPNPPAGAKTFSRDGTSDDTSAIQLAINNLKPGEWLVFPPGNYTISKHITVAGNGVTLYGKGATIHAVDQTDGAIMIESDHVAVYGFTMSQDTTKRQSAPWAGGIAVYDARVHGHRRIEGSIIQGNTISVASGGIGLFKVNNFTVAGNKVYRTRADGIHVTGGSTNGRVIQNDVSQTGDDMIAIVSYVAGRSADPAAQKYKNWPDLQDSLNRNILAAGNRVSDQFWGRGITVVGGKDITIIDNVISRTPIGAGIYLTREKGYVTFGVHNVLIAQNTISDVQTQPPSYKPPDIDPVQTHQGAIEIGAQMADDEYGDDTYRDAFSVDGVAILNNKVQSAHYAGIRAGAFSPPDTIHNVIIQGNEFNRVGSDGIVQIEQGVEGSSLACSNNKLDGMLWPSQCRKSAGGAANPNVTVTGASLVCAADGTVRAATPN